jgi:hypothetical protein
MPSPESLGALIGRRFTRAWDKRDEDGNGSQLQRSFRNIREKHLNERSHEARI